MNIEIPGGKTIEAAAKIAVAQAIESGETVCFVFGWYDLQMEVSPDTTPEKVVQEYSQRYQEATQKREEDERRRCCAEIEDLMGGRPTSGAGEDALNEWSQHVKAKLMELVEYKLGHSMR